MYKLKVQHFFDASHQLPDTPLLVSKGCARLHGHSYYVIVELSLNKLNNAGMIIDFKAVKDVIDILDHRHVNDVFKEQKFDMPSTAENIAYFIASQIQKQLNFTDMTVSVCEGYKGRERSSWVVYTTGKELQCN